MKALESFSAIDCDVIPPTTTALANVSATYYHFLPKSDRAVVQVGMGNQTVTLPMGTTISITGYWTVERSFTPLQHGTYTQVAGDEWGALALLHFSVN